MSKRVTKKELLANLEGMRLAMETAAAAYEARWAYEDAARAALPAQETPKEGLTFLSVNLGRVTDRWETDGTKFVTACVVGGDMNKAWVGLVFFRAKLGPVSLTTGDFLRVGVSEAGTSRSGLPRFNVGWAELRGRKKVGFKKGVAPLYNGVSLAKPTTQQLAGDAALLLKALRGLRLTEAEAREVAAIKSRL